MGMLGNFAYLQSVVLYVIDESPNTTLTSCAFTPRTLFHFRFQCTSFISCSINVSFVMLNT